MSEHEPQAALVSKCHLDKAWNDCDLKDVGENEEAFEAGFKAGLLLSQQLDKNTQHALKVSFDVDFYS